MTQKYMYFQMISKINRKIFLTFPKRWFLWFFWILSGHLNRIPSDSELFKTSCTFLAIFFPTTNLSWRRRMSYIDKCRSSRPRKHKLWISILSWFSGSNWKIGATLCWWRFDGDNCHDNTRQQQDFRKNWKLTLNFHYELLDHRQTDMHKVISHRV